MDLYTPPPSQKKDFSLRGRRDVWMEVPTEAIY